MGKEISHSADGLQSEGQIYNKENIIAFFSLQNMFKLLVILFIIKSCSRVNIFRLCILNLRSFKIKKLMCVPMDTLGNH